MPMPRVRGGILSLAHTLSGKLHPRGIRVNGLSLRLTGTPAFGKLGRGLTDDVLRGSLRELIPIGFLGTALELAKATICSG